MNELPEGWTSVELRNLTNPIRPRCEPGDFPKLPFIGMEQIEAHTRKLLGTVPAASMRSTAFRFFKADVLYGRLRPYLNKVYCAEFDGLCSSEFIVLPSSEGFSSKYLHYFLNTESFVAFANKLNQGDRPRVSFDQVAAYQIPFPPLNEQRRIVAKLEKLLGRVDAAQARLAIIPGMVKRFRESVLTSACSGHLTAHWRAKNESAVCTGDRTVSQGERLPENWREQFFGDFIASSFYGPRFSKDSYTSSGVPTIRTTDMGFDGSIVTDESPCLRLSSDDVKKYGLQHGDLLITRTGATIGKCALYDKSLGPAIPSAYLIRFRLKVDAFAPKFALFFFMSPRGQRLLVGGSTAVAQPNVNATTISQFLVPVPPLAEQKEIVRRIEALFTAADELEARYRKAKAHVDKLTQSILGKAFRGELVPQDPNDEPAAALLDRLRRDCPELTTSRERIKVRPHKAITAQKSSQRRKRSAAS
jgi:type I restriction enzyme S subunit